MIMTVIMMIFVYAHIPMGADNAERYVRIAQLIDQTLHDDETGAFLTLGDPLVYSTYAYIMFEAQKYGIETRIIPGITSFTAAASALTMPMALKDESVYLADGHVDEDVLRRVQTVCVLKPRREKAETLEKFEI